MVRATRASGFSPGLLEALVFVESSGRPEVTEGARAGLTQIPDWTAKHVLHVHMSAVTSARLTRQIAARAESGARSTAAPLAE